MRKTSLLILSIMGLSFPDLVLADEPNSTSDFKFLGYVDESYNYLARSNHFISETKDRVFDINPNGFTLQQASLTLAYQPQKGFGAFVNPIAGRDPFVFAAYGINPDLIDSHWLQFDIPQAFLQYAMEPLTIIGGRFVTITGAEVIDPTQDTNFSRSILFGYAIPFTMTGLRGTYVVNEKLTLIVGVDDGWDNVRDWGRGKTIELGLSSTINSLFSFSIQGYSGDERAIPFTNFGPIGRRNLVDSVITVNATKDLTFIVNYDYAWQTKASLPDGNVDKAIWTGIAGYINYKFNNQWRTSFRGEVFDDREGFRTGVIQVWKELTLTVGYAALKNCEIRGEIRYDFSNAESFVNKGPGISKNQQSFALEAYYKFG